MKIYKDKELTEEVKNLNLGTGRVGDQKTYTFYVMNENEYKLENIVWEVTHKEVKIIDSPTKLGVKESSKLELEWSPSVTLKEALLTNIVINFDELHEVML